MSEETESTEEVKEKVEVKAEGTRHNWSGNKGNTPLSR